MISNTRPKTIRPKTIGFDSEYEVPGKLHLEPGAQGILVLQPQEIFRVDRIYFETEGLIIEEVRVGNRPQSISGVPSNYYKEVDEDDGMKGRPHRLDTAEVGNTITFRITNRNNCTVIVQGCVEGVTVL